MPNKEHSSKKSLYFFIAIIILIIFAAILYYTGNYPFDIGESRFLIGAASSLAMVGGIYLVLKYFYKPEKIKG